MFTTCLSAITTPFAHTFPLMAISYYSQFFPDSPSISLVKFSFAGILSSLIIFALLMLVMKFVVKPDFDKIRNIDVAFLLKDHVPMSKQEKVSVAVFAVVLAMWVFPGVFNDVFPTVSAVLNDLGCGRITVKEERAPVRYGLDNCGGVFPDVPITFFVNEPCLIEQPGIPFGAGLFLSTAVKKKFLLNSLNVRDTCPI